jgi:hypothetical protein
MAEALRLLVGGSAHVYAVTFGLLCLVLQVFLPYKLLCALAEVADAGAAGLCRRGLHAQVPGGSRGADRPPPPGSHARYVLLMVVAVFGTTISPYLFFWQAAQEMEDSGRCRAAFGQRRAAPPAPHQGRHDHRHDVLQPDRLLHHPEHRQPHCTQPGVTDIQTSAQAAEALRPIAGDFTFLLFGLGIIGTGMLAVPVLAGSAAYAVAEAGLAAGSLSLRLDKGEGRASTASSPPPPSAACSCASRRPTRSRSCSGRPCSMA